jgi:uncharacterized membrane protein (DUF2068 family)
MTKPATRPVGITALSIFFIMGAVISFTACVSLLFPQSFLHSMWRLNPHAREGFASMGRWAIVLLGVVCISCALAAAGLWRGARWGYWLAIALLVINLTGDVANTLSGTEPKAVIGVPIVAAILVFLMTKRVRAFFSK